MAPVSPIKRVTRSRVKAVVPELKKPRATKTSAKKSSKPSTEEPAISEVEPSKPLPESKATKATRGTKSSTTKITKPTKIIITPASQLVTTTSRKRKAAAIESNDDGPHDELAVEAAPKPKSSRKVAPATTRSSRSTRSKSQDTEPTVPVLSEAADSKGQLAKSRTRKAATAEPVDTITKPTRTSTSKRVAKASSATMKKATISVALDPEPAEEVLILTKSTGIKKKVTFVDELGQENMPPPVVTKARRGTRATATVKTVEAPGPAKPRATARRPVKRTKVAHTEETEVAEQVKTPLSPKKITQITRPLTVSEEQGTPKRASTQIAMRAPTPARPMAMRDVEMEHHPQHIATPDQLAVVDAAPSSPIRQVDAPKIGESPRRPVRSPPATAARQPPKRFNPINLISTGMAISPAKGVSTNSPLKAPPQKFAVVPAEFGASHVAPTPGRASVTNTPARRPPRPMLATDELDSTASNSITTPGIRPLGFFGRSKTPGPGNTTTPSMAFQFRSVRPVSRSFQISPSRISKHSPLKAIAETPFRSRASGGLADLLMIDASMAASSPLRARGAGSPRDDVPVSGDAPPDPFSPIAFDTMDTPRMSLAGPVSIPTEMQEADGQVDQAPSFVLTSDMLNDDSMLIDDPVEEGANEVSAAPEDLADALQADDQTLHMSAIEAHHQPPQTLQNIMGTSFAEMILSQEDPLVNEVLEVDPSSSMLVEMIRPIPFSPVRATAASPQISESVVSSSRSHQDHGFYALNEPTSVRKLSYENEQAAREALNFGEEELVKSVIGKRMSAATAFEPPTLSSPIGKMTGVQVVEDMADPDIQQKDCQAKRKLFYENQVAVKEASLFAQPEEETTAPMPVGEDVQGSEQAEEALEGDVTPKAAERCITIATESPAAQSQEPGIASPSVDEMDARSAISEDLTEAEQAPSPAKSIPVFEDASLPQDDNATISAPPSTSANSESSAFDNNENAMPSIERPQTPEQQIQHKLKVFHTTAKIPLRPEGMMLMSPLRNPKRRASTAGFSPRKVGPKSPFGRRDLRAKERQEKIRAANTASASASASEKTPSELEPELSVVALEAQQQQTPVKQSDAEDASPSLAWSAFATPLAARTPRPPRNEKLLQGAVVFLDIRTAEGEEASACYQQLLGEMGARCVKQWVWNPDAGCRTSQQGGSGKEDELLVVRKTSRRRTEGANANVGITHVVFKDGNVRTMEKVRAAAGIVQCVTVRWVLDCEKEQLWMPEQPYTVDASHIPRGGHRRRKSMEPRALSVIDGNLVSNAKSSLHSLHPQQHQHQHQHSEVQNTPATATAAAAAAAAAATTISSGRTPALAGSTNRKVSSPLEDRLISFESSSDRRKSRNWTPRVISAEQHQELVAEHEEGVLHLDLHNDQQQQQRPSLGLCATPIARGDLSSMTVELTPMSGVVMHGLLEAGHADLAAQEPGTPYFLQPQQLVQRTCPPKQQGLGSGVLPDEDEEEDAGNERDGRGEVRRKLVWGGDARRVTMDWRPATASPLRRAF